MKILTDEGKEIKKAHADLTGQTITGTADFIEYAYGEQKVVSITIELSGDPEKLVPGKHAVHIHEKADCSGDFTCAGGHFDPGPYGHADPDENHPFHAGDLPNITIDENGKGVLNAITTRVSLSDGPVSILNGEGTALMVHGNPDPYKGGPHGSKVSGGPRVACGIIKEI